MEDAQPLLVQRGKKERISHNNPVYNGFVAGYGYRY